jgi:hypothetical protein
MIACLEKIRHHGARCAHNAAASRARLRAKYAACAASSARSHGCAHTHAAPLALAFALLRCDYRARAAAPGALR